MRHDNTLFIGSNGHVAAIRIEDGGELWRTELKGGWFSATGSADVCVLIHEGRVFAGCQGHLFCLDAASGKVIWHNQLDGLGNNDVTLAVVGQSVQFVARVESDG